MSVLVSAPPDVFVDWKQNVNEVTVRLRCGDGVSRAEDVYTSFTDTHCHVLFPGELGRPPRLSSVARLKFSSAELTSVFVTPSLPRWSSVELLAAGGDRGLVQQGAVQGEGRLPARHHAEEDPLSHLAVSEGESGQAGDSIPPPPAPGGILGPSGVMSVCTLHATSWNSAFY